MIRAKVIGFFPSFSRSPGKLSNAFPWKEDLLRKWYHADNTNEFESGAAMLPSHEEVLMETDSEGSGHAGRVLLQSDSEQEELVATPIGSDDILLATPSEGEEPPKKKQRSYATNRSASHELRFLGKPVCRFAHVRLYSVGSGALQRLRRGQRAYTMNSGRLQEPTHPSIGVSLVRSPLNQKWPSIMSFFWMLWISCAEILPMKFIMPGNGQLVESSMQKDPDFQERYVQGFLACLERNYDMNPVPGQIYYSFRPWFASLMKCSRNPFICLRIPQQNLF